MVPIISTFHLPVLSGLFKNHTDPGGLETTTAKSTINSPFAAAVPGMVSVLEQINTASGTWYLSIRLVFLFFSIPNRKEDQKQFAFTRIIVPGLC